MLTIRQIERWWVTGQQEKLFRELLSTRPEASLRLQMQVHLPAAATAMILLRLEELSQAHLPMYDKALRALLGMQRPDGSFVDPLTTALCLRALLSCGGSGPAVEGALAYLAGLQKSEGIWPNVPLRRMPADPFVSAFILYELGSFAPFRSAVRFLDAVNWFERHEAGLDAETRRLWDRAAARCRLGVGASALWS